jgi:hypothetical protein
MAAKYIVVGDCNHMKITETETWKKFVDALNHPDQEVVSQRKKFFEECDKLFITNKDGVIHVESDKLDTEEILKALRGTI